jgi:asparagine synthase (glutamine-hydrolysing)
VGLPLVASYFDQASRLTLTGKLKMCETPAESIWSNRASKVANLLHRATRTDFGNYLADDILVKVDRASMANSLEIRAPFLDYRIIEFAFGKVPSFLKVTPKRRKLLIKRLCVTVLPPNFDMDRKQGFCIPLGAWLRSGPWRESFNDILLGASDVIFDRSFVRSLLDGMSRGRSNSGRLFALALFESWRREYRVTILGG